MLARNTVHRNTITGLAVAALAVTLAACAPADETVAPAAFSSPTASATLAVVTPSASPSPSPSPSPTVVIPELAVTSADFTDGSILESTYVSCNGDDLNPELTWAAGPEGTVSYAITMVDTDADYKHWLVLDIPADVTSVARGTSAEIQGFTGRNSAGLREYMGPCPPEQHHYVFTVYALDTVFEPTTTRIIVAEFLRDAEGHILAQGNITGLYPADAE